MTRDPDVYPDPENFMPERFLDKDGKYDVQGRDPTKFVFGFGRRYAYVSECPHKNECCLTGPESESAPAVTLPSPRS